MLFDASVQCITSLREHLGQLTLARLWVIRIQRPHEEWRCTVSKCTRTSTVAASSRERHRKDSDGEVAVATQGRLPKDKLGAVVEKDVMDVVVLFKPCPLRFHGMDELPAERVCIVVVAMVTTVAVGRSHIERVLLRTTCQDKSAREKQERKNLKRSRASERDSTSGSIEPRQSDRTQAMKTWNVSCVSSGVVPLAFEMFFYIERERCFTILFDDDGVSDQTTTTTAHKIHHSTLFRS